MAERKTLGVLGGLGPMSSVYFYELVTENTAAQRDQDHVDMILSSRASTPDRTDYILGKSDANPLPVMKEEAAKLVACGADVIALTCNTAHYFYEELQSSVAVPVLNIGALAVEQIQKNGVEQVGLLATSGTVRCGIYQEACAQRGIRCIAPDEKDQNTVMEIIYGQVKKGLRPDYAAFHQVCDRLREQGAKLLILGCTELSLLNRGQKLGDDFVDPLEILARAAIQFCGHELVDND